MLVISRCAEHNVLAKHVDFYSQRNEKDANCLKPNI